MIDVLKGSMHRKSTTNLQRIRNTLEWRQAYLHSKVYELKMDNGMILELSQVSNGWERIVRGNAGPGSSIASRQKPVRSLQTGWIWAGTRSQPRQSNGHLSVLTSEKSPCSWSPLKTDAKERGARRHPFPEIKLGWIKSRRSLPHPPDALWRAARRNQQRVKDRTEH